MTAPTHEELKAEYMQMQEDEWDRENPSFELKNGDLAGFDMSGVRLDNGDIKLHGSGRIIKEFPKWVWINGNTFGLEDVQEHENGQIYACYC